MIEVTSELLERHDRPGPRYTSYPTAVEFSDSFTANDYAACVRAAAGRADDPLSLYVHLPFCDARCSFCACHVVVTKRTEVADAYLRRVVAEADLLAERLGDRRTVAAAVIAGVGQVLFGSLAYLIPVLLGPGPRLTRNFARMDSHRWLPLTALNGAAVALIAQVPTVAVILLAVWLADFLRRLVTLERAQVTA